MSHRYAKHIRNQLNQHPDFEFLSITQNKHFDVKVQHIPTKMIFSATFPVSPGNKNAAEKGVIKSVKTAHRVAIENQELAERRKQTIH